MGSPTRCTVLYPMIFCANLRGMPASLVHGEVDGLKVTNVLRWTHQLVELRLRYFRTPYNWRIIQFPLLMCKVNTISECSLCPSQSLLIPCCLVARGLRISGQVGAFGIVLKHGCTRLDDCSLLAEWKTIEPTSKLWVTDKHYVCMLLHSATT